MDKCRYTSLSYALLHQPTPGQREIRFRPAKNTFAKRPREAQRYV